MVELETRNSNGTSRIPRFSIRTLLLLTAIVAFSIVSINWIRIWLDPFAGRKFNRYLWHQYSSDDNPDNPRASMVSDLRWQYLDKGMTRTEVKELLGTPDFERRDDLYSYNLGMWSGFRIDYDSLDIHFDSNGRLINVRRVQH